MSLIRALCQKWWVGLAIGVLATMPALAQVVPPPSAGTAPIIPTTAPTAPAMPAASAPGSGVVRSWVNGPQSGAIPSQPLPGAATQPVATPTPMLPPLPSAATERDRAFQQRLEQSLSPQEIVELHKLLMQQQQAAATVPNPPRPVTGSVLVSLAPGATPPVIRIFQGIASTITVVDSTGAPWPVTNVVVGNPSLFQADRLDGPQGSVFALSPLAAFGTSNLVLMLKGNPSPVMLTVIAGQKEVDERTEVRIDAAGPEARIMATRLPPGADPRLQAVLDGVPPAGARALDVVGNHRIQAWLLPDQNMIVRTPWMLLGLPSSGVQATSSAGGIYVYEIPATPRLAVLDPRRNEFINLTVRGL